MFALDIGTRFIVGIISDMVNDSEIIIKDVAIKEHENRAMLDGQIHDVTKVSKGVEKVINELKKNNNEIKNVAVALAGRFLVTAVGEYEKDISEFKHIDYNTMKSLELEAVKNAVENLDIEKNFYCVGYSVLYYELDGEWIKKLEGQKGNIAKVKVIAAFLPKNVVDAMLAVLELNNLEPVHITLEPIAAMNLIVPEDLRTLNIAMVDVGAGTSDIAISKDGTIIGYGMVPMAGDEISEAISKELLVDFKTAELIKRTLNSDDNEIIKYKDILDFEHEITKEEIMQIIEPVIEEITSKISEKILELNGKPPIAVMVVGGGGKVPEFIDKLSLKLNLSRNRITLKNIKNIDYVKFENNVNFEGSEFITPVGIAYVAHKNEGNVFARVMVNNKPINMMLVGGNISVIQVLLQAGFTINDLVGKPAPAISYELNGELKFIPGEKGKEAPIKINGLLSDLKTPIKPGDIIEVGKPEDGKTKKAFLKDVIKPYKIFIDGQKYEIYPRILKNGKDASIEEELNDGDKIETKNPYVKDITLESSIVKFIINNVPYEIPAGKIILRNGVILGDFDELYDNDNLNSKILELPAIKDFVDIKPEKYITVTLNGNNIELPVEEIIIKDKNNNRIDINSKVYNNMNLKVEKIEKEIKLLDLFLHIDFDISNFTKYRIFINEKEIFSFNEKINNGDIIRMEFE
ncbi:cell division protein FtsA [Marinitoga aeolica]|uniref:Pilus assembly protein PilM n=1 Tax=Marinitoga aeolica TaxID=2809031 RepID=A0ABY8PQA8_9BACT|nr:cell division FtsA domain-containing protein [Marinitoga aeolica]WGS64814.1 pilus assembly protein PilM [Marinitoga aeolica]